MSNNQVHETDPGTVTRRSILSERTSHYGMIDNVTESLTKEETLQMFETICFIRYFEFCVRQAHINKQIKCLIYLSNGQESMAAATSLLMKNSWVSYQHRCHGFYLAFGGDPIKLIDELLGLPTGCNKGMGGSNCLQDLDKKLIGHNGLIGDNVPIGCGVAFAKQNEKHVCFFGDGAAEEDYVLGALGFAATHKLPMLFICDDNDLSVLTPTEDRRTWKIHDVAKSFGMPAVDITDDPWLIAHYVKKFSNQLPALINIRECREFWHQGTGVDGEPEWNRFDLIKKTLVKMGLEKESNEIELKMKKKAEGLWQERLQTLSEK